MTKLIHLAPRLWAAASIVATLAACGGTKASDAVAERKLPAANPLEIEVRPDLMQLIRVGEPSWTAVAGTLRVAGRVEADETRMARVSAPVTGRIVHLEVIEGQKVEKGQMLATIHSTDLASAQSSFLKALTQHQLGERAVSRARQLLEAGVIGSAELQRREAELEQAVAELSSSREQLGILGMSRQDVERLESTRRIDSVTHVVSTISGRVLERRVTIGQVVQGAEVVCVVADLSNVWLVADVPEQSAGAIEIGKEVQAEIPALPGEVITGKLSFVSAVVNPETRTVRTHMDLPNPHRRFKPSMLATITLVDGAERRQVVPSTAVVRDGNDDGIFVQTGPNRFVLRAVTLGEEFRDRRVLMDGVNGGEKIVVDGAFHLNNERRRAVLRGGGEGE